jgi:hypothetical protein
MVRRRILKIIISNETGQTAVTTGSTPNKWGYSYNIRNMHFRNKEWQYEEYKMNELCNEQ